MSKIKRNTDPLKGPPDGVEMDINCALTQFDTKDGQRVILSQGTLPCNVKASYEEGTIGFSVREIDLMVHVRIDELMEILKEGAEAHKSFRESLPPDYMDAELEKRWDELSDVPFDDADSPSGLILADEWWIFPKGADREDIWKYFDAYHSKGVHYLLHERTTPPAAGGGGE
jgi:hypothetical protein